MRFAGRLGCFTQAFISAKLSPPKNTLPQNEQSNPMTGLSQSRKSLLLLLSLLCLRGKSISTAHGHATVAQNSQNRLENFHHNHLLLRTYGRSNPARSRAYANGLFARSAAKPSIKGVCCVRLAVFGDRFPRNTHAGAYVDRLKLFLQRHKLNLIMHGETFRLWPL